MSTYRIDYSQFLDWAKIASMAHPEEEIITKARTTVRLQLTQIAQLDQQVETKTALSEQLQAHLLNKLETEKQLGEITKSEENMRLYNQIMDILE